MFVLKKFSCVLVAVILFQCFTLSNGISVQDAKLHSEEGQRSLTTETKNELISSKETPSTRTITAKRGILPLDDHKRHYDGGLRPPGYGDYEPGRYGGTGGGYPHSGVGHHEDDRGPPFYEPDEGYPHGGGGGFIGGRPSGYGHNYGHSYGPPSGPSYHGGYEEDHHYQGHSDGGNQGIGGIKALTLKKILIPLAGLAILGVAAAASQNPVLLQLGSVGGRRKRSLPPPDIYPPNPVVKPLKIE